MTKWCFTVIILQKNLVFNEFSCKLSNSVQQIKVHTQRSNDSNILTFTHFYKFFLKVLMLGYPSIAFITILFDFIFSFCISLKIVYFTMYFMSRLLNRVIIVLLWFIICLHSFLLFEIKRVQIYVFFHVLIIGSIVNKMTNKIYHTVRNSSKIHS